MNRYTFVVQVHADGPSTLENLSTHEVIRVPDLAAIGPQIERWLGALPSGTTVVEAQPPARTESAAAPLTDPSPTG